MDLDKKITFADIKKGLGKIASFGNKQTITDKMNPDRFHTKEELNQKPRVKQAGVFLDNGIFKVEREEENHGYASEMKPKKSKNVDNKIQARIDKLESDAAKQVARMSKLAKMSNSKNKKVFNSVAEQFMDNPMISDLDKMKLKNIQSMMDGMKDGFFK